MTTVRLVRVEENFKYGTFGIWIVDSEVMAVTLEPADLENASNVSSIPAQQYMCERYSSEKYPNTFQVMNVPERSKVLIHAGNVKEHTKGCILLAEKWGKICHKGVEKRAALNSGNTFDSFLKLMDGIKMFQLTIIECY